MSLADVGIVLGAGVIGSLASAMAWRLFRLWWAERPRTRRARAAAVAAGMTGIDHRHVVDPSMFPGSMGGYARAVCGRVFTIDQLFLVRPDAPLCRRCATGIQA